MGPIQSVEALRKKNDVLQRGKNSTSRLSLDSKSALARTSRLLACPVDFRFASPHNYMSQFLKTPPSTSFLEHACVHTCTYTHTLTGFVLLENPTTVLCWEILLAFLISFPSSKPLPSEKKKLRKRNRQVSCIYCISWVHSTEHYEHTSILGISACYYNYVSPPDLKKEPSIFSFFKFLVLSTVTGTQQWINNYILHSSSITDLFSLNLKNILFLQGKSMSNNLHDNSYSPESLIRCVRKFQQLGRKVYFKYDLSLGLTII